MAPPSHLFVVRHGNRYDVVDKEWHRTSSTPYDPPLTYGGWLQSKSLGARIASILSSNTDSASRRRRYNVVIHSSPFLRCVQTSIAISAGICQPLQATTAPPPAQTPRAVSSSTTSTTTTRTDGAVQTKVVLPQKVLLRLDAFLGEWLSPDYFEGILSPPSSSLMLAGAHAELLRPVNRQAMSNQTAVVTTHKQKPSVNGALWTSSTATTTATTQETTPSTSQKSGDTTPPPQTPPTGYSAPTLNYAVGVACPIPEGFVAHARDACVALDYQWDSTLGPLNWGDGGTLPEEWQSMHKRLKRGLQGMVDWYATNAKAHEPVTVTAGSKEAKTDEEEDGDDVETVVIVVSHGAGCNAMIGAITNKPVLIDVNVASLTMAQRQTSPSTPSIPTVLDQEYTISILANTDHYRPNSGSGTPPSVGGWNSGVPFRSRVASMSTYSRPTIMRPFTYSNLADSPGQKDQTPRFDIPRRRQSQLDATPTTTNAVAAAAAITTTTSREPEYTPKATIPPQPIPAVNPTSQFSVPRSGLWAPPTRNTLLDADDDDDLENMLPDFDNKRLSGSSLASTTTNSQGRVSLASSPSSRPPILMPPIELLSAALAPENEEAIIDLPLTAAVPPQRAGLWENSPRIEAKRRWTVNER